MKLFVILLLSFQGIFAEQCSYIQDRNIVRCQNVASFGAFSSEMQSDWTRIEIINKIGGQFDVTGNVDNIAVIQYLDLSKAGKLIIDDTGFREFDGLLTLNISYTKVEKLQFSWFNRKNLVTLNASKNKIKTIKKDDMKALNKLKSLNISSNLIDLVEANAFTDMKQLETLTLNDNNIKEVIFGPVENLKSLNLRENLFEVIKSNAFTRLAKIEKLTLAQNQINNIQDNAFAAMEKLKILNISSNSLKNIKPAMFAGLLKAPLAELDLSQNSINNINPSSFDLLRQLLLLDLSKNSIPEIQARLFVNLNRLKILLLNDNDILTIQSKSFENLLAMEILELTNNKIKTINADIWGGSKFSGNKLKTLNLAHNKIQTIPPQFFNLLLNLEVLDLSQNEITDLNIVLLKNPVKLRKLLLDHNNFEVLPHGIFDSLVNLQELRLNDNKLTFMPNFKNDLNRLQTLTFENNPWQCPCLKDVIQWSRRKNIQVNSQVFNGVKPVCVVTPVSACVKNATLAQQFGVLEKYMDAIGTSEINKDDEF